MRVFDNASKIKPPYILLVNHQSGFDFIALHQAMYPRLVNGVIAYNQMLGHKNLWLKMGMIPKRQFDLSIGFFASGKESRRKQRNHCFVSRGQNHLRRSSRRDEPRGSQAA